MCKALALLFGMKYIEYIYPRWAHITNNAITYLITGENATVLL